MIIDRQLPRYRFGTVERIEVRKVGIVAKGQNARSGTCLRQKVLWPEHLPALASPCPRVKLIAAESVDEYNTTSLVRRI
jgi:hypothetical protein